MDYLKLGNRIKEARKNKGYTQGKLAELTGYSVQHISHIETGNTKLSVESLVTLANVLDVSLDHLMSDSLERKEVKACMLSLDVKSDIEKRLICNIVKELQRGLQELNK